MIGRRPLLSGLAALCVSTTGLSRFASRGEAAERVSLAPALARAIADAGQTGVLAFELEDGTIGVSDLARAGTGFIPASTFKIPKWDGKERGFSGKPIAAWNRDQALRDAFKNSAVWVYQEVARRIGAERMQQFLEAFRYGNRDLSGAALDAFWLTGRLRITALEQIRFLGDLRAKSLPVSDRAQTLVHEAMEVERTNAYVLRGKTGWADDARVGWFVGWIESGKGSRLFALNIDMKDTTSAKSRVEIVKTAARDIDLI